MFYRYILATERGLLMYLKKHVKRMVALTYPL